MITVVAQPKTQAGTNDPAVPQGYKRTEVGVIPHEWEVLPLRACLHSSPRYGINAAAVAFDGTLPAYLRITDISKDGRFTPSPKVSVQHPNAPAYYLTEGDLVFARTGASVGKSYLYDPSDGPLVFAGYLIRVTPDPAKLDPAFLAYFVQSKQYWDWVGTMSIRSGQPGINGQEYGTLNLPAPHITEQRAIAEALWDVDGLIGALDKLIAKKRAIKQAAMQPLLTGKTRLPGFSGKWETKKLGEIVAIQKGQLITESTVVPGSVPVVAGGKKPAYFHNCANRTGKTVTVSASGANAGFVAFFDVPIFASDCSTISEGPSYSIEFIFFQLLLHQSAIYSAQTGGAQPHIHPVDLMSLEIALPSLPEQQAIAAVLSDIDAEIAALERRRDKTKQVKQGMMQSLLTGRVRLVNPLEAEAKA